jgi:hypothetical protein
MRLIVALLALLALLVLLPIDAGCAADIKASPKTPAPAVKAAPVSKAECMARVEAACVATHKTALFTKACVRRNQYRCR